MPKSEAHLRRALAYPNQPTAFTRPGEAAAARTGFPLRTLPANSRKREVWDAVTKTRPMEARVTKEEEAAMKAMQQAELIRARELQRSRMERDPDLLQRLLGGGQPPGKPPDLTPLNAIDAIFNVIMPPAGAQETGRPADVREDLAEAAAAIVEDESASSDWQDVAQDTLARVFGGVPSETASIGPAQMQQRHIERLVRQRPELADLRRDRNRAALTPENARRLVVAYLEDISDRLERGEQPLPWESRAVNDRILAIWRRGRHLDALIQAYNPGERGRVARIRALMRLQARQ